MRYIGRRHHLADCNPLRSLPLIRPAIHVLRPYPMSAGLVPAAPEPAPTYTLAQTLANTEARLREATRCFDQARRTLGEANARRRPAVVINGHQVAPGVVFPIALVRQRQAQAMCGLNRRRAQLSAARKAADAARIALGLPTLAQEAGTAATKAAVRASKRRPVQPMHYLLAGQGA